MVELSGLPSVDMIKTCNGTCAVLVSLIETSSSLVFYVHTYRAWKHQSRFFNLIIISSKGLMKTSWEQQ